MLDPKTYTEFEVSNIPATSINICMCQTTEPATLNVARNIFGHQKMFLATLNVARNIFWCPKMFLATFNVSRNIFWCPKMFLETFNVAGPGVFECASNIQQHSINIFSGFEACFDA